MLQVTIPEQEYYDDSNNEFIKVDSQELVLEHSLVSISKWESKWKKAFLGKDPKTPEEIVDYVKCMTINKKVDPRVYSVIPDNVFKQINAYIEDSMTATWFSNEMQRPSREIITSELVYYWMIAYGIPFECQKWHLNRLLTLIRICGIKNAPSKKMSKSSILANNSKLNAARRAKYNSRG